jgi:hypothetical protein
MFEAELKEYEALRQEILFDLKGMQRLFYLVMIVVGGIFSYGLVTKNGYVFLIGPVVVISCIGYTRNLMLSVVRINTYIRVVLEKNIPGLNWETYMFKVRKDKSYSWEPQRRSHYYALLGVYDSLAIGCFITSIVYGEKILVIPICIVLSILLYITNHSLFDSTKVRHFIDEEKKIINWAKNQGLIKNSIKK